MSDARMTHAFLGAFLAVAALAGLLAARSEARSARGTATPTYVFSTAVNELDGNFNEGWWSDAFANSHSNSNYVAGNFVGGSQRDYFSFDITSLRNPCVPLSGYLTVSDPGSGSGASNLTYGLYDVSTSAATLAAKENNPNVAIYNDLGSGVNYGVYSLSTSPSGPYTLTLNANGLQAIANAHAAHATFFTVGGTLIGAPAGTAFIMGFTGGSPVTLTATFPRACRVA